MKVHTQVALSLKTETGEVGFGTTLWFNGALLSFCSGLTLASGDTCELRLNLVGVDTSFYGILRVSRVLSEKYGKLSVAIGQLVQVSERDWTHLEFWLERCVGADSMQNIKSWVNRGFRKKRVCSESYRAAPRRFIGLRAAFNGSPRMSRTPPQS